MKTGPRLRRSTRNKENTPSDKDEKPHEGSTNDTDDQPSGYVFEGVKYDTYQEMVNAKRKRNQEILERSGLLSAAQEMHQAVVKKDKPSQQGLKKRKKTSSQSAPAPRRKSNRIAGIMSDGYYVEDERAGRFTIAADNIDAKLPEASEKQTMIRKEPEYYRGRINDGAPISIEEAVEFTGPKWVQENSVAEAKSFVQDTLQKVILSDISPKPRVAKKKTASPTSVYEAPSPKVLPKSIVAKVNVLSVDDEECVAKVVPYRIYGIATHPCPDQLIVCAGDKAGYVGFWNIDSRAKNDDNDGVHKFKFHNGAASCLEWTPDGSALFSSSYDGTVRWFDVASETFEEIFATYDDSDIFKSKLGYDLDTGYRFWTQYGCLDPRFHNHKCFFLSTSVGTAMHIDMRSKHKLTFHEELSEKKINTVSVHPNGHSVLTGGLDCTVKLWDLRKLGDSRSRRKKAPEPIAYYNCGKSVNSAYFSPSGQYAVTTTMANKLDIFENMHQGKNVVKPYKSVRHDNMTGRWLSTFMAKWHPQLDIFGVGSMRKPRAMEIFNAQGGCVRAIQGDALTAVASRCCFHPSTDQLTFVGGNSSGRVTVVR